jgi:hypothetical protein
MYSDAICTSGASYCANAGVLECASNSERQPTAYFGMKLNHLTGMISVE